MPLRAIQFIAIISVALCFGPATAHFFELPGKLVLTANDYMIVQKIYAGWAWFGVAFVVALITTLAHAAMVRDDDITRLSSLISFSALAVALVMFFAFVYPVNKATQNWSIMPEAFDAARRQWEYAHAVNAVLVFISLVAIVVAVLRYNQLETEPLRR